VKRAVRRWRRGRGRALLLAALWLILGSAAASAAEPPLALVDVTLVVVDEGRLVPEQSVLVRDGRIDVVGPVAAVEVPAEARVVPAHGRFLMPGLIDAHVHLPPESVDPQVAQRFLRLWLAHGVTSVRVMIGQAYQLELRRRVANGEILGPRLRLAGPALGLAPDALPETPRVDTAEEARRAVREQHAAGYDLVKLLDRLAPEAFEAAVETAHVLGIPVSGHVPRGVGLERALTAGLASVEHLSGILQALEADDSPLRGAEPAAWQRGILDHLDESKVARLAELARRSGTAFVPTLDFWEALFPAAPLEALMRRPGVEYLDPAKVREWSATWRRAQAEDPPDFGWLRRYHQLRRRVVRDLELQGARVVLGTDSPDEWNAPGVAVHRELARLVDAGLTPRQALRAATLEAAALLGLGGELGRIAVGQRADLLLLEADPLADVGNVARRAGVVAAGRWLPADELDGWLAQLRHRVGPEPGP